jgi:Fur family ferric uptake transcriptional regulator
MSPPARSTTRTTRQRLAVAELLAEQEEFRTAQDIHATLRQGGHGIGLATVYRTLALMVAGSEVDTLVRDDGETMYRRCGAAHHHHLVCRQCGRTVEIAGPGVERWARSVAEQHGFTEISHQLELFGLCEQCSAEAPQAPPGTADAGAR